MNDTAPNVIVIPAKVETPQEQEKRRHLRVAAYCRVSTDSEEQLSSYENQLSLNIFVQEYQCPRKSSSIGNICLGYIKLIPSQ